ncbi:MAG: YbjN domain-containing protein [Marinosulfonomonas sp.]|nr:YbjN domain-containing protein [Marinosulfonomonas sp.]PHQ99902.1 MAG: YbjN domain-containing protein [Marinosulfonomonas sp.]
MNFHTKLFGGFATAALIASSTIATAEITATDANVVMKAMQDFGLVATMGVDGQGDPKVSSRVSDTKFSVYFYGCQDNDNCSSILIKAGYDLNNGISALKINEWNREKRFAKAYIDDEGDPFLEMDVNLDFDGVGNKNFEDTLDWWRLLVEDFEEFIDW